jgi:hypothetical protein
MALTGSRMTWLRKLSHEKTGHAVRLFRGWQEGSAVEPHETYILEGLYQVLRNHHIYASRLDRLKQTLKDLVRPDNITKFAYIDIE